MAHAAATQTRAKLRGTAWSQAVKQAQTEEHYRHGNEKAPRGIDPGTDITPVERSASPFS